MKIMEIKELQQKLERAARKSQGVVMLSDRELWFLERVMRSQIVWREWLVPGDG